MKKMIIFLFVISIALLFGCSRNVEEKYTLIDTLPELKELNKNDIKSIECSYCYNVPSALNCCTVSSNKEDINRMWDLINLELQDGSLYRSVWGSPYYSINIKTNDNIYNFSLKFVVNKNDETDRKYAFCMIIDNNQVKYYCVGAKEEIENVFQNIDYKRYQFGSSNNLYDKDFNFISKVEYYSELKFEEISSLGIDYNDANYILRDGFKYLIYIIDSKTVYVSSYRNSSKIIEDENPDDICNKYYQTIGDIDFSSLFK